MVDVEPLDPNYENYAISLIEEEMHHVVANQQIEDHPSLKRLSTSGSSCISTTQGPNFGGNAPMAMAAYEELVARRADTNNNANIASSSTAFTITRPDPMAETSSTTTTDNMDEETLLSNLQTSINTSKIQLEYERIHHMNLELHQNFETPSRYTSYISQLENDYLLPTSNAVERQRRVVDGINGTRMEEQHGYIGKLDNMTASYESLIDKNRRLGKAVEGLENEVISLREKVAASSSSNDGGDGGYDVSLREGSDTRMEVAELSKEN